MSGPSRLDPSSPSSIAGASFSTVRKGYAPNEVRAALTAISAEVERLAERSRQLEAELAHARRESTSAIDLDEAALTARIGEETVRVLQTARESASQIKTRAEENAARLVADATDEISRMRHEADLEVARRRADATADAESELALAKQQGREMVNEARAYRERVLADLEARTARARQQLEELAHGRERLLQVFERARLVAIDVATELGKHPGPNELVNLANTTGPVPVMVPAGRATPEPEARPDVGIDDRSVAELATPDDDEPEATDADAPATDDTPEPARDEVEAAAAEASSEPAAEAESELEPEAGAAPTEPDTYERDPEQPEPEQAAAVEAIEPETETQPQAEPEPEPVAAEPQSETASEPAETTPADAADAEPPADEPEPRASQPDNVVALFARLRQEASGPAAEQALGGGAVAVLRGEPDAEPQAAVEPTPDADPADPADSAFARRDEALVPLIVTAARKLKRVLADEQNGVLDVLRGRQAVTSLAALLPGADDHAASYAAAIADELQAAAAAGAEHVGGRLPASGVAALAAADTHLRSQLVGALRDRLDRSVAAGAGDNADVTRGVRNVYREFKTQHIDDQLDDVFRAAYGGGAAAATAPGTSVEWQVEPGQTCCADCADNTLAGALPAGSEFPTGHTAAPAHPGCRCLVVPV